MAKNKEIYLCSSCGAKSPIWKGQCSVCQEWNTLELVKQAVPSVSSPKAQQNIQPLRLVSESGFVPYSSGMEDLDRILGQGLLPGAAILIGGEPGIGKSTLLMQLSAAVAASGKSVLYASGEENLPQIKSRAERLGPLSDSLLAVSTTRVDDILPRLDNNKDGSLALLVVDSVQTLASGQVEGLPGNAAQVKAVATELVEHCKQVGTTLILVGHVTKDGNLAGPRLLEHLVDTVISLEGERSESFRMLRVLKNRYGPNQELLVLRMEQNGLQVVHDPSTLFLEDRDPTLSGTALVMALDGQRPFVVEIQALAARSYLAVPRRAGLGFDVNRLHLLLAVLEKRLRLNFGQADIFAKVGGGLRLAEPGLDLGLIAALLSSFYDIPLPEKAVFWGEVDLNGQIRPVPGNDIRMAQAGRLGYLPWSGSGKLGTVQDLQKALFKK